jgi:predicted RNase H-like HicB family nuclease
MRYPIAIEPGTEMTAFGVVVPDLPGCFSAGDTLDEAMEGAGEAVAAWIDAVLDAGAPVPAPSGMGAIRQNPDYAGWTFGVITIGPGPLRVERDRVACDK